MDRVAREKLKWKCRQGLLELDLMLARYMERHATEMTDGEAAALGELLDLPDNDLWEIVSRRCERYEARQRPLVKRLRAA